MAILKNTTINDTGFIQLPTGTTAQRPSSPTIGMMRFNTQVDAFEIYDGYKWAHIGNPPIVSSGLVMRLDAAKSNSYPGTGTTWTDLVGNNNGTLTNGVGFTTDNSGALTFNGVNQGVLLSGTNFSLNQMTISVWNFSSNYNQNGFMFEKTTNGNVNTQYSLFYNSDGTIYYRTYGLSTRDLALNRIMGGVADNRWNNIVATWDGTNKRIYVNGSLKASSANLTGTVTQNNTGAAYIGIYGNFAGYPFNGRIAQTKIYNRALTPQEVQENYLASKDRYGIPLYEKMTYFASNTITLTNNGTFDVSMFKTSGNNSWDSQVYSLQRFTAPCTIEFQKQAASSDNGVSYAMIGWNEDPLTNASYTSIDHASYPYRTAGYQVYNNGSLVLNTSTTWSPAQKFYLVYDTDGFIRHYNGSTLLYSANYGTGKTVYVDSSLYSPNATFGGFSSVRVAKRSWNGTQYV